MIFGLGHRFGHLFNNPAPSRNDDQGHRFMALCGIRIPDDIQKKQEGCHSQGYSLVYVAIDNQLGGGSRPTIRPEAKGIVSQLRKRNMSMYIISGDHEKPTKKLAQELGIEHYFAETLPENT